jgi:type I restriction enzyme, S subunit
MELKAGSKKTEIGVIPDDWNVQPLGDIATFRTGPFGSALHKSDYIKDGVPVINPMHINDGGIVPSETMTVSEKTADKLSEFKLASGEIVIGRRGEMGRCAVVLDAQAGWLCGTGSMIVRPKGTNANFLQRVLSSRQVIAAIENASVGTTMVNLNQGTLSGLKIQFPPFTEQVAIATALSDVDDLLSGLDKLIAKKRDLKQAAMQQLLTGKTRLRGFEVQAGVKQTEVGVIPNDWDVFRFDQQFNISAGGDVQRELSSAYQDDVHPYPIYSNALIGAGLYGYCSYADHPAKSLTITARGTLGVATYRDHKYTAIGRVLVLEPKRESACAFFADYINSQVAFAIESTGVPQLTAPQIGAYSIAVPPLSEQSAIANVLSDMDAELAALEARREKTHLLKQAMMQELLTGKTRLV